MTCIYVIEYWKMFLSKKKTYDTESDILEGCKENVREAQKKLYDIYSAKFNGICLRYMKDQRDAEEVLANSFMKIFTNISKFRSEGSFEGWMKRIVVNESLAYLRKRQQMYLEVDIEDSNIAGDFSWEDSQLEANELIALIQSLPSGYRTIFNLYAIEGFSHKEIAVKLGISEGTSKSQLSRARLLLQDLVKKNYLGGDKQLGYGEGE